MKSSEQINELATALSAAQAEFPTVKKDADNPFFKSKYANLASIIETVKPILGKHGLSVVQIPATDVERKLLVMETVLLHKSGQWISGEFALPVQDWKPQGMGSATTYAQRYSCSPMLFVASDKDDDDGNAASANSKQDNEFAPQRKSAKEFNDSVAPKPKAATQPTVVLPRKESASPDVELTPATLTPSQVRTFWADVKKTGAKEDDLRKVLKELFGIESTKDIQIGQVGEILEAVREAVAPAVHGQPLGEF